MQDETAGSVPEVRNVFDDMTPEERAYAEERLVRYMEIIMRIYGRAMEDPERRARMEALTSDESDLRINENGRD